MDLLKPLKAVVGKVKDAVQAAQDNEAQRETLQKWQSKLMNAKATYNLQIFDEREYIYLGTHEVDGNINSTQKPTKKANNVYSVSYEMVESKVNTQIPQPSVKSKRPGFDDQAKMIEDSTADTLKMNDIERNNDITERITYKQGYSILTVEWDPGMDHHLYKGDVKIGWRHPKTLIPQPKVYELQKMDYFFVLSSVTKDYIKRRYSVELTSETEQYPEVTSLSDTNNPTSQYINNLNEKVTEIVCWYKDDDGDICKYVWTDDDELEDMPKYFHRRLERCTKCGTVRDGDVCTKCGNKKFKTTIEENETLAQDTEIGMMDQSGQRITLPSGTQIPYYVPKRYPFVIRVNVPQDFAFGGQSDIDVIRDQQDSINKVVSKAEEKLIKAGSLITIPDELNFQVTNETYQIVRGSLPNLGAITVKDMTASIDKELEYIQEQRQLIQNQLGITNSFQGLQDQTAQSGKAKQIQVQQASGRLQSTQMNKYAAFKELFQLIFDFRLAFCDEPRPYVSKDQNGNDDYGEFNKYLFLLQDDAGKFYYNTDFIFSADAGSGIPKDPMFIFNQALQQFQAQAIDKMQYWTILEGLHFPMAKQIKGQIEEQMKQQQEQQAAQQQAMQQQQQQQPQEQPIDPHGPAMDVTKLQLAHQQADAQRQHEIAKMQLAHHNDMQKIAASAAAKGGVGQ